MFSRVCRLKPCRQLECRDPGLPVPNCPMIFPNSQRLISREPKVHIRISLLCSYPTDGPLPADLAGVGTDGVVRRSGLEHAGLGTAYPSCREGAVPAALAIEC